MMDDFIKYLQSITNICPLVISEIINISSIHYFSKKEIIIPELSKSTHLYFICKGVVRAYFYHNDKEITDWFGIENMIIGNAKRNFRTKDSIHRVEALEDTELISVSFSDLELLFQKHHDIERLGRLIAIDTIFHLQHKIDSLQLLSAKERYEDFNKMYPTLFNRVPLGYIASYLGMNQVTLSRIRKKY